jgi:hypothetical protein
MGIAGVTCIEAGSRKLRQPGLGELRAVQLEERRGDGVEAERFALLQDDSGKLAPHFDDERLDDGGLGHGLHHRLNLLLGVEMVTRRTFDNGEGCRISPDVEQITRVRHQYGAEDFSALALPSNMTEE